MPRRQYSLLELEVEILRPSSSDGLRMTAVFSVYMKIEDRHLLLKGARLRRRPLQWFGGSPIRDEFEDAVDGIAAGQGGEGEDAVGAVFADGFDEEADGAEEREGGGPRIAPGAVGARHAGFAKAEK